MRVRYATIIVKSMEEATITLDPMPTLVGSLAFLEDPNGVRIALIEHR